MGLVPSSGSEAIARLMQRPWRPLASGRPIRLKTGLYQGPPKPIYPQRFWKAVLAGTMYSRADPHQPMVLALPTVARFAQEASEGSVNLCGFTG